MDKNPISAPRRLGSAATSSRVWELASKSRSSSGLREVRASGFSSWGRGKPSWKYLVLKRLRCWIWSHRLRACAWHFGQQRERQELKEKGASYVQSSHVSRCPPRAAVRQRFTARYALS